MFKRRCLTLLLLPLFFCLSASASLKTNNDFLGILKITDQNQQEIRLVKYILNYYGLQPVDSLAKGKQEMNELFIQYKVVNRVALNYFNDYTYNQRISKLDEAEKALVKAIQQASHAKDLYLLYAFYNELGFLQTFRGSTSDAVYSFSMAKKQAIAVDSATYQVIVDINLSDIFYKNSFYKQSLSYLEQAQGIYKKRTVHPRLINIIYNNIAENYYRTGNIDSLKKYNTLLRALPDGAYKKYIFVKRSDYYLSLLQHDHKNAINSIKALRTDSLYRYDNSDDQNLADAYYHVGMLDSAKRIFSRLLADPTERNHPEVKTHFYKMLGLIAEQQKDYKAAAYNFKMSQQQAEEQIGRLTQVDNISSQIKLDEIAVSYNQKEEGYKKERLGLILVLIITILVIAMIAMIFSATSQRRYYEKKLFDSKRDELSFINSHEVRRHLSNLLGLVDLIKNSEDKHKEYLDAEEFILREAEALDGAIKTISEKLDSDDAKTEAPATKDRHTGLV
jgi:tetratricopeptide (TPR) repeat protein